MTLDNTEIEIYKQRLLEWAALYHDKNELASALDEFDYDPGNTENLQYYDGIYNAESKTLIIKTEVRGLRYENRSEHLEDLKTGDAVEVRRDPGNPYNSNNFEIFDTESRSLGVLPADLCNRLAPLYDIGYLMIENAAAHYIEQLMERSRYSKQGVLFITLNMRLEAARMALGVE